jgi:hypothetical protein
MKWVTLQESSAFHDKIAKRLGGNEKTMIQSTTRAGIATIGLLLALCAGAANAQDVKGGPWRTLFDGKTLNGWTAKVAKHPVGENYRQTFVADHGVIRVSYAGYDKLDGQFGHLFYKTPFKAYRLKLTYRFLTEGGLPDTPAWARSNSGIMFLSQSAEGMTVDQPFPVSIEFQLLGKDGDAPRSTGSVCTPGLTITIDGTKVKEHCTVSANAPTIPNGTWVQAELEVLPNGQITQKINGVAVHHYADVTLDPDDTVAGGAKPYILARGAKPVTEGYIALQSEGHPIEFKGIEIQELTARSAAPSLRAGQLDSEQDQPLAVDPKPMRHASWDQDDVAWAEGSRHAALDLAALDQVGVLGLLIGHGPARNHRAGAFQHDGVFRFGGVNGGAARLLPDLDRRHGRTVADQGPPHEALVGLHRGEHVADLDLDLRAARESGRVGGSSAGYAWQGQQQRRRADREGSRHCLHRRSPQPTSSPKTDTGSPPRAVPRPGRPAASWCLAPSCPAP